MQRELFWAGNAHDSIIMCDQCMLEDPEYFGMLDEHGQDGILAEPVDLERREEEDPPYCCEACGYQPD